MEYVDILIPCLEKRSFAELHQALLTGGYEFLNTEDTDGLYDMLLHQMGIRIARRDQFIPNIELKFLKDDIDRRVFHDRVEVNFPDARVHISPVDIHIAYKLYLGSERDIEALPLGNIQRRSRSYKPEARVGVVRCPGG